MGLCTECGTVVGQNSDHGSTPFKGQVSPTPIRAVLFPPSVEHGSDISSFKELASETSLNNNTVMFSSVTEQASEMPINKKTVSFSSVVTEQASETPVTKKTVRFSPVVTEQASEMPVTNTTETFSPVVTEQASEMPVTNTTVTFSPVVTEQASDMQVTNNTLSSVNSSTVSFLSSSSVTEQASETSTPVNAETVSQDKSEHKCDISIGLCSDCGMVVEPSYEQDSGETNSQSTDVTCQSDMTSQMNSHLGEVSCQSEMTSQSVEMDSQLPVFDRLDDMTDEELVKMVREANAIIKSSHKPNLIMELAYGLSEGLISPSELIYDIMEESVRFRLLPSASMMRYSWNTKTFGKQCSNKFGTASVRYLQGWKLKGQMLQGDTSLDPSQADIIFAIPDENILR